MSEPAHPSVAVVLVTHDRPHLLVDALRSVQAQTRTPSEIAIGDGGTNPVDEALLAGCPIPIEVVRVPQGNPGGGRNRAVARTRAPILAFLDDDDRWSPAHLEGLVAAFERPEVEVAYRDSAVIRETIGDDGTRQERDRVTIAREWDPAAMRDNDYIPPSALAFRRSAFDRLGGFDTSFPRSEDWDLLLRAARSTTPVRVPGVSVEVRLRDAGNLSAEAGALRRDCLDRLAARHGLPPLEIKTFWEVAKDLARRDAGAGR